MSDTPTQQDLFKINAFTDDTLMPFGKFKGAKLIDVPDPYLYWWFNTDTARTNNPALYDYCEERLEDYDLEDDGYTSEELENFWK